MPGEKKALEITGRLMSPLMVGAPAMVAEKCNWRCTSAVVKVLNISEYEVQFETVNTKYLLHLVPNVIV